LLWKLLMKLEESMALSEPRLMN